MPSIQILLNIKFLQLIKKGKNFFHDVFINQNANDEANDNHANDNDANDNDTNGNDTNDNDANENG